MCMLLSLFDLVMHVSEGKKTPQNLGPVVQSFIKSVMLFKFFV